MAEVQPVAVSLKTAAAMLEVSARMIRRMVDAGELPTVRVGRLIRIPSAAPAEALGIPRPKQLIDGSKIPALHEAGEVAATLTCCAIDAMATARAFQLTAGLSEDLK